MTQPNQTNVTPQTSASRQGAWVTLHVAIDGTEKRLFGFLIGQESGLYKLTKLVNIDVDHNGYNEHHTPGTTTVIHDGVWLVNPMHVWLVEHEPEIPIAGFVPAPGYTVQ